MKTAFQSQSGLTGSAPSVRVNPSVFVVGCPRSGTTLLQRMLDNHPELAVTNDTHFIPRVIKGTEAGVNPPLTAELIEAVRSYRRIHRLGLSSDQIVAAAEGAETFGAYISNLYMRVADEHGKTWAGEKTPDYVRCLPLLHDLLPSARVIHIIRDGRDVALSTLQWATAEKGPGRLGLWKDEPLAVCAMWWRLNVGLGRLHGRRLGDDVYTEVQYQSLVDQPAAELARLAAFLQLPFCKDMESFHVGRTKENCALSAKSAWLPATSGLRNWRTDLAADDIALFEAIAGDLLQACGFECITESIPEAIADRARHCIDWWESEKGALPTATTG